MSNRRGTVLLVDDESFVRESLSTLLERRGFEIRTASSVDEALEPEQLAGVDAVVTDLKMPKRDGLALVREIASQNGPPTLVLTAFGTVGSAVECLRAGASDYLLKPTDTEELVLTLDRCIERAQNERERNYLRQSEGGVAGASDRGTADRPDPIGESPSWMEVVELAEMAARARPPVLLMGETGTGKEEVARLIHRRSERSNKAFVAVNCAAVPVDLFESEFFGHRRGAFTGAVADREGRFRIADGGTLFLDEINSLPQSSQAKVLRVLEDGMFERLGDSRPTRTDVRLICASNSRLEDEVEAGRFRADLFYRINVVQIELPPLRQRRDDVELLARAFLSAASASHGKRVDHLDERTIEVLRGHEWPGNVRELKNVIERGVLLETTDTLRASSLPPLVHKAETVDDSDLRLSVVKARAERGALVEALRRSGGVRKHAAKALGVDERNLAYYLRKHDLLGDSDESKD